MGIWVQALCTVSVADALPEIEPYLASLDLAKFAREVGLQRGFDVVRTRNALTIEAGPPLRPPFDAAWFAVSYGDGDFDGFSWDHCYADPEVMRGEAANFRDHLPARMTSNSKDRIVRVLDNLAETVSTRLPNSCGNHLMWPLARETAFWLARRGAGLVVIENEWYDPVNGRVLR